MSNVKVNGVTYNGVTSVRLPLADGSGYATFSEAGDVPGVVTYTITNNLTNVSTNNPATSAEENSPYTAILTANEGFEIQSVTVTVDGTDITSVAYADGVITINEVSGDVVITALAVVQKTSTVVEMTETRGTDGESISSYTIYSDEGQTPVETTHHINTPMRYVSEPFQDYTTVTIERTEVVDSAWTSLAVGECAPDNPYIIYNGWYKLGTFTQSAAAETYEYTVSPGRCLILLRRQNNYSGFTLVVMK